MLDLWLSQVKQRQQEQDGPALASLVSPDPTSHSWQLLRHNLQVHYIVLAALVSVHCWH